APAANSVCSLPRAPRACPGRVLSCASRAGPTCVGGGRGGGWRAEAMIAPLVKEPQGPHPQPLPSRLRACPLPPDLNVTKPRHAGVWLGGEHTDLCGRILSPAVAMRPGRGIGRFRIR